MGIDAFVLRYKLEGSPFAIQFLGSADFDTDSLKSICRELGLSPSKPKNEMVEQIALIAGDYHNERALQVIIQNLIAKKKPWATIKTGEIFKLPKCDDPLQLVINEGKETWYGPISCDFDEPKVSWYIRQKFIVHWELSKDDNKFHQYQIRWLIFARIHDDTISLHWRGFSYAISDDDTNDTNKRNAQFEYWRHIPEIFDEIEQKTGAKLEYINLHDLILQKWWELFRNDPEYTWRDRRIRAESSGVSLNAHAGAVFEIEAGGIKHLANTIRRSVERELSKKYGVGLPEAEKFDEVILQTLIREYGTLSYEFSLEKDNDLIFRAHAYFGQKQLADSADKFPHLYIHITQRSDLQQLSFILQNRRASNANNKSEQISLFG